MKKILFLLFSISCAIAASAQDEAPVKASKAVYGEIGGSGLLFSANFDSRFKGHKGFGFRVGVGGAGGTGGGIFTFPVGVNYLTGNGPHHFEAGVTATLVTAAFELSDENASDWFALPHFGYRYSKPSKSFNGRIYVGPIITNGIFFFPFGGLSVGYTL